MTEYLAKKIKMLTIFTNADILETDKLFAVQKGVTYETYQSFK